jgi:hypothetical protein
VLRSRGGRSAGARTGNPDAWIEWKTRAAQDVEDWVKRSNGKRTGNVCADVIHRGVDGAERATMGSVGRGKRVTPAERRVDGRVSAWRVLGLG